MTIKKIISSLAITAFVLFGAFAPISSYAADPVLTCTPTTANVAIGQQITFTATGGNGTYAWNAPSMVTQTGSQLTVYYPLSGTSSVIVSSGGQTAVCNVTIAGPVGIPTLSCGPLTRSVAIGANTTFSATGGTGNYVWNAPQMTPRTGNQLTVSYASAGNSTMTVTSGTQTATCNVVITGGVASAIPVMPTVQTTPGLPNTGMGGASSALLLNMGMVLGLSGITTLFVNKKMKKVI